MRERKGQSTTEYLLVISVLSIAISLGMGVVYTAVSGGTSRAADQLAGDLISGRVQR